MSSPSLPELPPLSNLKRCTSQPSRTAHPTPPGPLPRHLIAAQPVAPQHELPPLRGATVLHSRGSSRLHSSSLSRRPDVDLFFDTRLGETSKSSGQLHSRASTRALAGRFGLSQQMEVPWLEQDKSPLSSGHDLESLKRAICRLTQVNRDRDNYIKELLAAVEIVHVPGEAGMQNKIPAVAGDCDLLMEQSMRHENEICELRKALCRETELRLSERAHLTGQSRARAERMAEFERQLWLSSVFGAWSCAAKQHEPAAAVVATTPRPSGGAISAGALLARAVMAHELHVSFRTWAAAVALEHAEVRHAAELLEVVEAFEDLREQVRTKSRQLAYMRAARPLAAALREWSAVVRFARKEAAYRYQMLTATADASSELYRASIEARRTALELRRQRRAHGVAAVHASLDRRLQAVVHAWSSIARDAQRESVYQRQLDIAAAESAASCAVLRMEGRRVALEFRHQRRVLGLRAVRAEIRHVRQYMLYAWKVAVGDLRQERMLAEELTLATDSIETARVEIQRVRVRARARAEAHAAVQARLRHRQWQADVLSAWATAAARSRGEGGGGTDAVSVAREEPFGGAGSSNGRGKQCCEEEDHERGDQRALVASHAAAIEQLRAEYEAKLAAQTEQAHRQLAALRLQLEGGAGGDGG